MGGKIAVGGVGTARQGTARLGEPIDSVGWVGDIVGGRLEPGDWEVAAGHVTYRIEKRYNNSIGGVASRGGGQKGRLWEAPTIIYRRLAPPTMSKGFALLGGGWEEETFSGVAPTIRQAGVQSVQCLLYRKESYSKNEFDPGSERTLAICSTHASRTLLPCSPGGLDRLGGSRDRPTSAPGDPSSYP
ncbi:hypothetical protein SUGI_1518700 [Cryptomeria japonica]|uniref:Uncharacterized protein n=1 Tax=Cryptomeria japonica TaxID=3369 RepID=A0AAD3NRQ7_CRYJA|nr:hypothetical protein SUGI_1424480 [Cryptomeria japonica]GLJ58532.1 hypothetical protein SUGI_1455770 [Cryptomeria japonica]GLJ58669.1 hypothetical protein SUGI_1466880 [Cryptomeria japonica]GLJ58880.1 hypothetical protein SUGI_1481810 [Cryptomeria japonica]GLJ59213.1 hypothetical protein SUGI_1497580 [Cryptomeria japonica]